MKRKVGSKFIWFTNAILISFLACTRREESELASLYQTLPLPPLVSTSAQNGAMSWSPDSRGKGWDVKVLKLPSNEMSPLLLT